MAAEQITAQACKRPWSKKTGRAGAAHGLFEQKLDMVFAPLSENYTAVLLKSTLEPSAQHGQCWIFLLLSRVGANICIISGSFGNKLAAVCSDYCLPVS
ncbi:MAG: hypothetical protein WB542_17110 [Polaromonas sp.]